MYKIIGADGKEYGPVSPDQLRHWLGEGRINAQPKVKSDTMTEWQALGALPEFAAQCAALAAAPPLASGATASKVSGLAITSLVLGMLGMSLCGGGITALVGLVLGIIALVKIKNSQGRLPGAGLAIAGTAVSVLALLMWLPALVKERKHAQMETCVNNMKQLNLAAISYANEHNDQLPPATNWCDTIQPNVVSVRIFQCPSGDRRSRSHYAFNAKLAGVQLKKITNPATTVLFFETDGGWNLSGGPELMLKSSRHRQVFVIGFADGHVESVAEAGIKNLRWDP
jgi:prepilin-type processing-associated H-X9-DG protein